MLAVDKALSIQRAGGPGCVGGVSADCVLSRVQLLCWWSLCKTTSVVGRDSAASSPVRLHCALRRLDAIYHLPAALTLYDHAAAPSVAIARICGLQSSVAKVVRYSRTLTLTFAAIDFCYEVPRPAGGRGGV